jgi:hypothetical protein
LGDIPSHHAKDRRLSPRIDDLLNATGHWFLYSGIQEESGGVARYYRCDLAKNALVSTEITGYAVSILLFLHSRLGDTEYFESALRAARFLTRTAWEPKLAVFPFEHSTNGHGPSALAYFFDTGIIIRGLLAAWRVSPESELLDICIAAGRAMLTDFNAGDVIHPILALPHKRPVAHAPRWSAGAGCYQLKAALAWYELYEATGEIRFLRAYESALEKSLATEKTFLPGEADPDKIMDRLHAYTYFLEGLLPVLHYPDPARVFRDGISRTESYLHEIAPVFERSDVYAQLLRLRLYGESLGALPLDTVAAADEARHAIGFQLSSEDPHVSGGFSFGRKFGKCLPFVNPASSAFCAQALTLWADHKNNAMNADPQSLI